MKEIKDKIEKLCEIVEAFTDLIKKLEGLTIALLSLIGWIILLMKVTN